MEQLDAAHAKRGARPANLQDGIRVAGDDPVVAVALSLAGDIRSAHERVFVRVFEQDAEESVLLQDVGVALVGEADAPPALGSVVVADKVHVSALPLGPLLLELENVVPGHRVPRPEREPAVQLIVSAAELGERLLEYRGPELVAVRVHVFCLFGSLTNRDPVVNRDDAPLTGAPVPESNPVLAPIAVLPVEEAVTDRAGMLRERSHGCDEPTVADGALAQVRRFDLSLEEVHALTLLDHGELIGADELNVPRILSVTDGPDTVEPGVLVVVAAAALAQEAAKSTDEAPGRAADVDADAREEVDGDGLVDEHERKQQKVPESNGARRWRSGSVSVKPSRMSSMFFGTGFKDRGASISSCHAPEAVRAAGANPIQLEQIRITGLVQVRCSFFHHHGVRRRLYQAPGPGGCYVDRPVRHHREFSKSNFPPWFGVGMGQSMESGCLAQLDSQK